MMQSKGISSNAITFTCILKACGEIGARTKGKQIHCQVLSERLLEKDVVLGSALVDMYAKCDMLAKAQEMLEELPIRNVVSWSALIAGYVLGRQTQEAFNCLEVMQIEGLSPDATAYTCILQACGSLGNTDKGGEIHKQIASRHLLKKDTILGNALVDMYAKCGKLSHAENALEELNVRNVVSWNALISGYVQHGAGHEALACFGRMQSENISPTNVTLICILKACGIVCAVEKGQYIHDLVMGECLLGNDMVLSNALLDMYTKCGMLASAKLVFEELPVQDIVSWNTLITGYVQQGKGKEALSWFPRMQNNVVSPNVVTFICLLNACGNTKAIEKGKQLHNLIMSMDLLDSDIVLGNALVDMYSKCGFPKNARKVLDQLPNRNAVTWNALISGYAQVEQGLEGLKCFAEMQREGLDPSVVTFICILNVCSSVGAINIGEQIHEMIRSWSLQEKSTILGNTLVNMYAKCGLLPKAQAVVEELVVRDVVSWNTLITGYAQHGQGQEAMTCFRMMQLEGICPNGATFTCILNSCGHSGLLEEAQVYFAHVKGEFGVFLSLQHYTCMVAIYSSFGCFDKALSVMKMMPSCDYSAVWIALFYSCRKWGNLKLANWAFKEGHCK
jgi:pentatricopeptide repeat protein